MVVTYNDDISDNHFKTPESEVMWDAMCTLRLFFTLKHFWHILHWNGFSPVCIR